MLLLSNNKKRLLLFFTIALLALVQCVHGKPKGKGRAKVGGGKGTSSTGDEDDEDCDPKASKSKKSCDDDRFDMSMPLEEEEEETAAPTAPSGKSTKRRRTLRGRKNLLENDQQTTADGKKETVLRKFADDRKQRKANFSELEQAEIGTEESETTKMIVPSQTEEDDQNIPTAHTLQAEGQQHNDARIASTSTIPGSVQLENLKSLQALRRDAFLKHTIGDMYDWDIHPFMFGQQATASDSIDLGLISVATQLSYGETKVKRLLDLATRWTGYISAVVYIDGRGNQLDEDGSVQSTIQKIGDFYDTHASILERVSIHVVVDRRLVVNREDHYPHNFLRNQAIDYAWTDQIALLDVDFIPSLGSHDQLLHHLQQIDIVNNKELLILPAFEKQLLIGQSENEIDHNDLPPTKQELLRQSDATIQPFHASYYPGHGPTDFAKWYQAEATYPINYDLYFEPYFVIHRSQDLPLFWEHFSGFGRNKQSWVEELALADYQFYVNPDAFLVHINHGYGSQDARFPRPFVMREYAGPFQEYLQETYDYTYWTQDMLQQDLEKTTNTFYHKMLHVCRSPSLFLNQTSATKNIDAVVDIPYQCKGEEYGEFGKRLFEFAKSGGMESPEAGMRRFPLPVNSSALVLGNSHTQQVVQALICQYFDVVRDVEYDGANGLFEVTFQNGATLVNMAESSALYYHAKGWRALLEVLVGRSLESFDAIVVGKFDKVNSKNQHSIQYGLRAAVKKYFESADSKESKQGSMDDVTLRYPKASDIAAIYAGPMVVVSPFSTTSDSGFRGSSPDSVHLSFLDKKTGKKVVEMLDARKYVPALGECGSYKPDQRSRCDQTTSRMMTPEKMNRCVGRYGGHPDLIAWDVIEFFHREIVIT